MYSPLGQDQKKKTGEKSVWLFSQIHVIPWANSSPVVVSSALYLACPRIQLDRRGAKTWVGYTSQFGNKIGSLHAACIVDSCLFFISEEALDKVQNLAEQISSILSFLFFNLELLLAWE